MCACLSQAKYVWVILTPDSSTYPPTHTHLPLEALKNHMHIYCTLVPTHWSCGSTNINIIWSLHLTVGESVFRLLSERFNLLIGLYGYIKQFYALSVESNYYVCT